jgi:hypothetical protein
VLGSHIVVPESRRLAERQLQRLLAVGVERASVAGPGAARNASPSPATTWGPTDPPPTSTTVVAVLSWSTWDMRARLTKVRAVSIGAGGFASSGW